MTLYLPPILCYDKPCKSERSVTKKGVRGKRQEDLGRYYPSLRLAKSWTGLFSGLGFSSCLYIDSRASTELYTKSHQSQPCLPMLILRRRRSSIPPTLVSMTCLFVRTTCFKFLVLCLSRNPWLHDQYLCQCHIQRWNVRLLKNAKRLLSQSRNGLQSAFAKWGTLLY